ncbi:hypothetical protein FRC19_004736 [Serendipita sp. 401]|nr:hypothetical protein FRC19_004736 [Serendipita sp. 401]
MLSFYLFLVSFLFLNVQAFRAQPRNLKRHTAVVPFASADVRQCGTDAGQFQDIRLELLFSHVVDTSSSNSHAAFISLKAFHDAPKRGRLDVANETDFRYHIHQNSCITQDLSRDCTLAGSHYDPYGAGKKNPYKCDDNDPETCEAGDLSGKHGVLRVHDLVGSEVSGYFDEFVSLDGVNSVLNRAVVVHTLEGARVACGDIQLLRNLA